MDILSKKQRSYCMSRIRAKGTKPETQMASILKPLGLRLRKHAAIVGKPDLISKKHGVAIFVDGCRRHFIQPKSNSLFWKAKISANVKRDRIVDRELQRLGYVVIRIWEHELCSQIKVLNKVRKKLKLAHSA
ncbi:very short patch repair endonuclease [Bdellovibrio sp. HCB288]|uniref:very short patch repair endonuclease n=1 Tax=Bdellovibrio sp. HCB288 TaxID=3394355 RepID=UPI0039B6917A